jgi:hypothetical protein
LLEQQTVMQCWTLPAPCHDPGCPGQEAFTVWPILILRVVWGTRHLWMMEFPVARPR